MKKYLVRFDDICPQMNWGNWDLVEKKLVELNIKPIIGLIPNNKDKKIMCDQKEKIDFLEKIKYWQELNWSIALHGYEHLYETKDPGIVGINSRSEFAGLSYEAQRDKIKKALRIFSYNNVKTNIWMAPAHSFDKITIKVLKENDIKFITDGFYLRPVTFLDMNWIPQQIWSFKQAFPIGLWTVCFHTNNMTTKDIEKLKNDLEKYKRLIISIEDIKNYKKINILDKAFNYIWLSKIKTLQIIYKWTKGLWK